MSENPGTESVANLLKNVHYGRFVIPYFQRGFEWSPGMVSDLIVSILQDYYSGILLFWKLNPQKAKAEKWDPLWGAALKEEPSVAILDGQQRLSSLYYALYNPRKTFPRRKSYYVYYLDLLKALNHDYEDCITYSYFGSHRTWSDLIKDKEKWLDTGIIPLPLLTSMDASATKKSYIDSKEFESWLKSFIAKHKRKLPEDLSALNIYMVLKGILDYNFVFYPLRSLFIIT